MKEQSKNGKRTRNKRIKKSCMKGLSWYKSFEAPLIIIEMNFYLQPQTQYDAAAASCNGAHKKKKPARCNNNLPQLTL